MQRALSALKKYFKVGISKTVTDTNIVKNKLHKLMFSIIGISFLKALFYKGLKCAISSLIVFKMAEKRSLSEFSVCA